MTGTGMELFTVLVLSFFGGVLGAVIYIHVGTWFDDKEKESDERTKDDRPD